MLKWDHTQISGSDLHGFKQHRVLFKIPANEDLSVCLTVQDAQRHVPTGTMTLHTRNCVIV